MPFCEVARIEISEKIEKLGEEFTLQRLFCFFGKRGLSQMLVVMFGEKEVKCF